MSERFVTGSLTGYPITPGVSTYGSAIPTLWYVWDTAYAWRMVGEFKGQAARARAEAYATELNAWDEQC